ncbi:MAG: hypothetical protein E6J41_25310 [Chloroflexi bacterium]|nr:MAG: hypothetical protein E6J41_25310 [Chloroflexota bacterium]
MLRVPGPGWLAALVLLTLVLLAVRHLRCAGPYGLTRVLPWRLSKRPAVLWRERLFFGWGRGRLGQTRWAFGRAEDSVAVIGPPRVGKTAGVLIPQLAMWDGPAIVTSTKPDVLRATIGRRLDLARQHGGGVYVYSPGSTGTVEGLRPIRWSPLAGCKDPLVAELRASVLVTVADVGKNVENADHWRAGAGRILAAYFLAAANHPERPGDMRVAKEWLSLQEFRQPAAILAGLGTPGALEWAHDLIGIAERTNDKERSSFVAAAHTALKAMRVPVVMESCTGTDIDPEEFLRTRSTVYIVSPSTLQAILAPLISAFVEAIVGTAYELHGAHPPRQENPLARLADTGWRFVTGQEPARPEPDGERPRRLLLQLDELTNIAPLPSLESIVSQGAGQGVLTSWAVQSQAQLRNRYGDHVAEAIWSATRCKVVFGGLADGPSLDHLSRVIGDHRVQTRSWSTDPDGRRRETRGFEWRPRLSPAELRGLRPKWALLLYHHHAPVMLRAPVAAQRWRMRRGLVEWTGTSVLRSPVRTAAAMEATPAAWTEARPHIVHLEPPAATANSANGGSAEAEG